MRRRHKQGVLSAHGMRSMWEFVFVSQFLRVFQGKFGFVSFTAEELEKAFLDSESLTLFGIFTELLRILFPKRDVKTTTWQEVFKEELQNRSSEQSPFDEGKSYDAFSPEERVLLLKQLIDYLAEGEDKELKEFVKDFLNPNSLRVKPVGRDASNNIYWYFSDLRLYREVLGKKGRRTGWETVCINCTDWENLLSTFQKTSNSNEKKLYKYLKNELYPSVMPTVKENEKEKKLETVTKESPLKAHNKPMDEKIKTWTLHFPAKENPSMEKVASKRKTDKNAVLKKEEEKKETKIAETEDKKSALSEQEEVTTEEDQEQEEEEEEEEISDADEDFDPEDEEDSPPQRKKRKPPAAALQPGKQQQQQQPRRRGRPPASKGAGTDSQKVVEKIERRRKRSEQEQEQLEKDIQERKELEDRVEEEMQKQESIISAVGGESRAKRRCVIRREQMSKKKEWWEEEGLGFESEEDNERDIDSDSSDGPRRRKKLKFPKPAEMPEPPNRIYVFSTGLANRAAEAVQMGRVESITSFHRAQPSSSPFLKVEQTNVFGKQKPFYPQQYSMRNSVGHMGGQMASFSAGMTGGMQSNVVRPGYGTSQWDQMQVQQSMYKDRQRQSQSQAMEDIHQLLFGNSHSSNSQAASGVNGMYSRSGYSQQGGVGVEQSGSFTGYPRSGAGAPQQSAPYMERRTSDMRGQTTQQSHFPAFSQQASQQQQGYFHRPRHLGGHPAQGNSNSPSSDPLGAGVRSPPPPYPGARPPDSRHTKNSPVPSPTNTGSPHTPQTPLTPQTPRFPGPSPSEPSKPPFSPSHPQGSMGGPSMANYPVQGAQAGQPGLQAEERPINSQPRPGFIDLSSKTLSHGIQNPYSSVIGNYNQAHSPLDRRPEENKSPAFGTHNNHESPLHSPTDRSPASHFACGPPNKSPFMRPPGGQPNLNNSTFATTGSTIQVPKSFSVESLTAPSQPLLDRSSIPPSQLSEQPMPQYSSLYFPSNKYPSVFGQPQYQYPAPHMQHPAAFYNSQLTPNMYLGRASLPVYPPTRDAGL